MKLRAVNVFWGESFTNTYLDLVLPSHLAAGNLPAIAGDVCEYIIYTTSSDFALVKTSDTYRCMCDIVPVRFVPIDGLVTTRKYTAMSECHAHALSWSQHDGCNTVFLSPDVVWSNGSFAALARIAAGGCRLVTVPSVRTSIDEMRKTLLPSVDDHRLSIPPRQLVSFGLHHLHQISKDLIWNNGVSSNWPSQLYWPAPSGLLAHCFHLHPLLIGPGDFRLASTIDDSLSQQICHADEIYTVTDSDEMVCFELSCNGIRQGYKSTVQHVVNWARLHTTPHHRTLAGIPIRIHDIDIDQTWHPQELAASQVMADILAALK